MKVLARPCLLLGLSLGRVAASDGDLRCSPGGTVVLRQVQQVKTVQGRIAVRAAASFHTPEAVVRGITWVGLPRTFPRGLCADFTRIVRTTVATGEAEPSEVMEDRGRACVLVALASALGGGAPYRKFHGHVMDKLKEVGAGAFAYPWADFGVFGGELAGPLGYEEETEYTLLESRQDAQSAVVKVSWILEKEGRVEEARSTRLNEAQARSVLSPLEATLVGTPEETWTATEPLEIRSRELLAVCRENLLAAPAKYPEIAIPEREEAARGGFDATKAEGERSRVVTVTTAGARDGPVDPSMLRGVSSFVERYQVVDVSETFGESATTVERPVEELTLGWFFTGKETFTPDGFHGFLARKLAGARVAVTTRDIEAVALRTTELSLFLSQVGLRGLGGAYAITCKAGGDGKVLATFAIGDASSRIENAGQVCRALESLP